MDYERIVEPTDKKRKLSSSPGDGVGGSAGAVIGTYWKFPSSLISAERLSSSQPLRCRGLYVHHNGRAVNVVEFSDDSSLFVSGGRDGRVLLWPTNKATDDKWTPKPIAMDTVVTADEEVHPSVLCLSMSPDNRRIFSGRRDNNLLIHDANTQFFVSVFVKTFNLFHNFSISITWLDRKRLLNSFQRPSQVNGVALQPGKDGNICVTAGFDGLVRLFDTRRNKKGDLNWDDQRVKWCYYKGCLLYFKFYFKVPCQSWSDLVYCFQLCFHLPIRRFLQWRQKNTVPLSMTFAIWKGNITLQLSYLLFF